MIEVPSAVLVPGKGVEGDRYFKKVGTYSGKIGPDRECTLFEVEALDEARALGVDLAPREMRRNVAVTGIRLNELVWRTFAIGAVTLEGVRLCPPCAHLSKLTGKETLRSFAGRGGLRARIVSGGAIGVGDPISVVSQGAL